MTDTPSNQRRYPRTQVSFDIDVWVDGAGSQVRTGGRLVVLSAGGAFLELDDDYPVGRPLRLQFYLATLGTVGCRAILRRYLQGTGIGVEFLDIDPADRARITAFVEKHQQSSIRVEASLLEATRHDATMHRLGVTRREEAGTNLDGEVNLPGRDGSQLGACATLARRV